MFKKTNRFIPALLWMAFIFFLSSRQTTGIGTTRVDRFLILKSFHLIEYAVLFVLLFFATKKKQLSFFISYLYAISDELHQSFVPGRMGKFSDTIIDLIGIYIGICSVQKLKKWPILNM